MDKTEAFEIPVVKATNSTLKNYGYLVSEYENSKIEIATWPKQGWREIDEGTGNEAGYTEGSFITWWEGNTLWGQNNAVKHSHDSAYEVDGKYILGYNSLSENASKESDYLYPEKILICSN